MASWHADAKTVSFEKNEARICPDCVQSHPGSRFGDKVLRAGRLGNDGVRRYQMTVQRAKTFRTRANMAV